MLFVIVLMFEKVWDYFEIKSGYYLWGENEFNIVNFMNKITAI